MFHVSDQALGHFTVLLSVSLLKQEKLVKKYNKKCNHNMIKVQLFRTVYSHLTQTGYSRNKLNYLRTRKKNKHNLSCGSIFIYLSIEIYFRIYIFLYALLKLIYILYYTSLDDSMLS